MKKLFTILILVMSLTVSAQDPLSHIRTLKAEHPDKVEYEVKDHSPKYLIQLFDSVVTRKLTNGELRYIYKIMNYEYIDQYEKSTSYYWDDNGWNFDYNSVEEYDQNRRSIKYSIIENDTMFIEIRKYDGNGNLFFEGGWKKINADTLTLVYQLDQIFNPDGLITQKNIYKDNGGDPWKYRVDYVYYNDNQLKTLTELEWDGLSWRPYLKEEYTHYPTGDSITIIYSEWIEGNWTSNTKETEFYNLAGMKIMALKQSLTTNFWSWRYTWNYDSLNALTLHLQEYWHNGIWWQVIRRTNTNDNRGNLRHSLEESYQNNQWVATSENWKSYDANNFLTGFSIRHFSDPPFFDSIAYYFQTVIGISEYEERKVKVYPNPVNSEFVIDLPFLTEQIELFNISGTLVKILPLSGRIYSIADLPRGIYLLRVKTKTELLQQKIIKL